MQRLKTAGVFVWRIWFVLVNTVTLPFIVASALFFIAIGQYRYFYQVERLWSKIVLYACGFYLEKYFCDEKLAPDQQYMIVSNHSSMLDVFIIFLLHPNHPFVFVGKTTVKKYPLLGYIFKKRHIMVDRSDRVSRLAVYTQVRQKINDGQSICIFPEGIIPSQDRILAKFRDGAFSMAIKHRIPIVVYTIGDVKKRFPSSFFNGSPGKIRIKRHPIIQTKNLQKKEANRLKDQVYQTILSQLKTFDQDN